jgi:integrase
VPAIIAEQTDRRDRICLRLLLLYGIRKGSLQAAQFRHFDHQRRRLTIFAKGQKVRELPIPHADFWLDLERHILDAHAKPDDYLLCRQRTIPAGAPNDQRRRKSELRRFPDKPMSANGTHLWWYRCLANAGIVPAGARRGEHMHKARHRGPAGARSDGQP